jgi:hypothetical protein
VRNLGSTLGILAILAVTMAVALADIPPPRQFKSDDALPRSSATLVAVSDSSTQGPSGNREGSGSAYDTSAFCSVTVDIDAARGALGTFTVKGRAVPYTSDKLNAPEVDETAPIVVDASESRITRSFTVQLKHDVTDFYWSPQTTSKGSVYVWATAVKCGVLTVQKRSVF